MAWTMKEFTYLIPRKYLSADVLRMSPKPIAVRAWETIVPGLIVQVPISPTRRGKVHLTHKASGCVVKGPIKGLKTAQKIAGKLKRLPVRFTVATPVALYRQLAKLTNRQIERFFEAVGRTTNTDPDLFRNDCRAISKSFDEYMTKKGYGSKAAAKAGRSKRGK